MINDIVTHGNPETFLFWTLQGPAHQCNKNPQHGTIDGSVDNWLQRMARVYQIRIEPDMRWLMEPRAVGMVFSYRIEWPSTLKSAMLFHKLRELAKKEPDETRI